MNDLTTSLLMNGRHPQVNCGAGIASMGYSQGTHIATLIAEFNGNVSAAFMQCGARPNSAGLAGAKVSSSSHAL